MTLRFLLIAVLLCSGCLPPMDAKGPKPVPSTGITAAAEQSARDYATGMADLFDAEAKTIEAGQFKSSADLFDAHQKASQAVRLRTLATYQQALTDRLNPAKGFDATETAKAWREAGAGWRKAGAK